MRSVLLACLPAATVAVALTSGGETAPAEESAVASLTIRADWFDRSNVRVSLPGQLYADKFACIWNAGVSPNQSEYDINFPVTAEYTIVGLYTAAASRPVEIYLDGQKVHTGFDSVTGSWQTSSAQWETQLRLRITQGKHTIKLLSPGPCMPHICAFRLESPVQFPKDGNWIARPYGAKDEAYPRQLVLDI